MSPIDSPIFNCVCVFVDPSSEEMDLTEETEKERE